jgi:hypothetical protein
MTDPYQALPMAVPAQFRAQPWEYVAWALVSIGVFAGAYYLHLRGLWWLVGLIAWLFSHGQVVFWRTIIGPHSLAYAFDPRTQSKALLADVFIGMSIAAGSYGWRYLHPSGMHVQWWWPVVAFVAGLALAMGWYFGLDRGSYLKPDASGQNAEVLLSDPWKMGHTVVYIVLAALMVGICGPMLSLFITNLWLHSPVLWLIVAGLVIWGVAGVVFDGRGLNVWDLHDPFDRTSGHYMPGFRPQHV